MYVFENPVLQRELLVNLRTNRAFFLLAAYQLLLSGVVLVAWPTDVVLDLTSNPQSAKQLVDLFFLGLVINIITHIVLNTVIIIFIFKTDQLHLIMMSVGSGSEKVTSGF